MSFIKQKKVKNLKQCHFCLWRQPALVKIAFYDVINSTVRHLLIISKIQEILVFFVVNSKF